MIKYYSQIFLLLLFGLSVRAQQNPHFSLYRYHFNMFNPAVTGTQGAPFLNMTFRSQWSGVPDSPETQVLSFGTPIGGERIGIGLSIVNDDLFVERQTDVFANFSYRLSLNEELELFLGFQAGANAFNVTAAGLEVYGTEHVDPNLVNYSKLIPNVGAGAFLKHEKYYFSLSVPKILSAKRYKNLQGISATASDRMSVYAGGGVYIGIADRWRVIPSFLVRYVNAAPLFFSVNGSLSYNRTIDFGLEYNFQGDFGVTLMLNTQKTFSFGYAYVPSLHRDIRQYSRGSHEVVVKIKLAKGGAAYRREQRIGMER